MKRIFLVGSSSELELNPMLDEESNKFDDILQGDFEDTFRSVTYKVFMGLQFVKEKCQNVKYVIISDDDALVLPWNILPLLPNQTSGQFYGGFFQTTSLPYRDVNSPWYINENEFSCSAYPPHARGSLIVMTYSTIVAVYNEGVKYKYLPFDDVFIGGIAQTLQLNTTFFVNEEFAECSWLMKSHKHRTWKNLVVCDGAQNPKDQEMLWMEFCRSVTSNALIAQTLLLYCKGVLDF